MTLELFTDSEDPQVGNIATKVNASGFSKAYINALPAYRAGISPAFRGLEIGLAHGYFLYGPFAITGALRNSELASIAGLLTALGVLSILTIVASLYGSVNPQAPIATLTTPNPPAELGTKEGWSDLIGGFYIGGCSGAIFAYFLCTTPHLTELLNLVSGIWS